MGYDIENLGKAVEHLTHKVSHLTETASDAVKGNSMNDIAGLLALMQGNKGMDLPGLLALCKEKGYDKGWGGEGMFLFVFLILFLFAGGGWNNLKGTDQAAFASMAGNNCQEIIGLHDRIADTRSVSQMGFQQLQTWLCESIANVISTVRNQNEGNLVAINNVQSSIKDCCCQLNAQLATLNCKVDNLGRDIREMGSLVNAKVELEALKAENARAAMECRIIQNQNDQFCHLNHRFDKLECTISTNRLADDNARLMRENEALKNTLMGNQIADAAVEKLQSFAMNHYTPTRTSATTTT